MCVCIYVHTYIMYIHSYVHMYIRMHFNPDSFIWLLFPSFSSWSNHVLSSPNPHMFLNWGSMFYDWYIWSNKLQFSALSFSLVFLFDCEDYRNGETVFCSESLCQSLQRHVRSSLVPRSVGSQGTVCWDLGWWVWNPSFSICLSILFVIIFSIKDHIAKTIHHIFSFTCLWFRNRSSRAMC